MNDAITLLYLLFLCSLSNFIPPNISSSVKVILADPVVSIINLYLPLE